MRHSPTLFGPSRLLAARLSARFAAFAICAAAGSASAQTWAPLLHSPPGAINLMLLLSDGTVMACGNNGITIGNGWYRLTPDANGSYVNGTWTTLPAMHDTRLYFSSQVLMDGRVFIAGGEYGTGGPRAEVFDPTTSVWTQANPPTTLLNPAQVSPVTGTAQQFYDANSEILVDGKVLISPVMPKVVAQPLIFNPATMTWSAGGTYFRGVYQDEATWAKLPDHSILTIDPFGTNSERYIPATNSWINDGIVPVSLYDPFGFELGGSALLPNGKVLFLGSTGQTALYTPTGTNSPGTWAAGPVIPGAHGTPDAPCAMMPNGKVLCAVSPIPTSANHFPSPTTFYEYDYVTNSFASVGAPVGASDNVPAYVTQMLVLPDGKIMYSHMGTSVYVYTPAGAALAAGKPTITSVTANGDGSYHLVGTKLNGISEGASYGDDAQMNTNYPIVRLVSGANVYYARTYNWSSTGVSTGATPVTTEFRPPASMPAGSYSLYVVANGIASDPVPFGTASIILGGTGANTISDVTGNGNSNGRIDPGESAISLTVPVQNTGSLAATGVSATLVSGTPGVTVVNATSAYPNLALGGGTGSNASAFVLDVSSGHPCGDPISLTLNITSAQGNAAYNFTMPTGLSSGTGSPVTFSYSGPPVFIPDNNATGATANLAVAGVPGLINDVNLRFDGSLCNADIGSTTVGLDHTYLGDLTIYLRSPSGTSVTLLANAGGPGHNLCGTLLDDSAANPIQGIIDLDNPWTGAYSPAFPLSVLNGESPNGTWQLQAVDSAGQDTGNIRAFSLILTAGAPPTCDAPFGCPADIANSSGVGTPDGAVDINDLLFFLASFQSGSSSADLDNGSGTGTSDGSVDINDLLYFLARFQLGC